jgi:hypothetical protein
MNTVFNPAAYFVKLRGKFQWVGVRSYKVKWRRDGRRGGDFTKRIY